MNKLVEGIICSGDWKSSFLLLIMGNKSEVLAGVKGKKYDLGG